MKAAIPLTDVDVHVKQLNLDALNELGLDTVSFVFTGFVDSEEIEEQRERSRRGFADLAPDVSHSFDPSTPRRFAGELTLPRGRYYTLTTGEVGADNGTLVNELRAYYDPSAGGMVQIFDTTEPRDRGILESRMSLPFAESLVLVLLPYRGRPHPVAKRHTDKAVPFVVHLPLRVGRRAMSGVLDLRQPSTAERFAHVVSRLAFDGVAAFPLRPALDRFCDLLPEMLTQELGGGSLSKAVGLWLRREGVNGLIFPSARSDCFVTVDRGQIVKYGGWNLVVYQGAAPSPMVAHIDPSSEWADAVQVARGDFVEEEPIRFDDVTIECVESGSRLGSWRVTGLKRRRDAYWRFNQASALMKAHEAELGENSLRLLEGWLATRETAEDMGGTSNLVFEALMGIPESRRQLASYAEAVREHGYDQLADTILELLALGQ
jgi:hypothetical protein